MPSEAILASAAIGTRRKARPPANQGVGLLLMDSSLNPISCNDGEPRSGASADGLFAESYLM